MADYRVISDTEVDPDAPVTSELAYAFRDNPIAIGEGAAGAPRVMGRSLDIYLGTLPLNASNPAGFTGMDRVSWIAGYFSIRTGGSGTTPLQVRYSVNGGVTWGGWNTTVSARGPGVSPTGNTSFSGSVRVNLATGQWAVVASDYQGEIYGSGTHTVPPVVNAVQFRKDSNVGDGFMDFEIHGGVA